MKQSIIDALYTFAHKRPRLDFADYGSRSNYMAESRAITQDLHHARTLLRQLELSQSISAEDIIKASKSAFSGRLTITATNDGIVNIDYCTGQYFPTEYRKAVAAVCASVLWAWYRDKCGYATGESIRQAAKRNVGQAIARHYFN